MLSWLAQRWTPAQRKPCGFERGCLIGIKQLLVQQGREADRDGAKLRAQGLASIAQCSGECYSCRAADPSAGGPCTGCRLRRWMR